ncbi:hypothetical protein K432DRAFT_364328 [Lepidopterella palustris CBS 459.81]|uniref:Protein NO VEIN C-terminal domain-containing protein n=1 Tax=Lepidopterella palustris CBS 459.81 TaxID=1314670 RepID=A0A8E2DYD2_9PEZI|nr:hypothetical protein K432DRAFT_364328 [Lepidopterella palustris CBS 459.81]
MSAVAGQVFKRALAREAVEKIAGNRGYISEDDLAQMPSEVRQRVIQAMFNKDQIIASSVVTPAQNLYTSNARFVFELLQNADDNHYSRARAAGAAPFLSFQVHSQRIVVECNEDGFTTKNLEAICNVGKSSKTGAQGYIGEKGIGFKSVFMAAWKVHIQSADFSFYFQHRHGDSGMGMISPVWQEPEEDLASPLTRITLFLHESGDAAMLQAQRETIFQQFRELHDTVLLFLKNLEQIDVKFYDDGGSCTSSTSYSIQVLQDSTNRLCLQKVSITNGNTEESKKYFHVTKHIATNLAKNENRTYSEAQEIMRAYATAEVVLAFPLTESSVPIIESQETFAFLPVRNVGFKADFVTQANRQDIVTTSERNLGLVDGIADAFIKAVLQFCEHSTLQYQWMRYLPQDGDYPWNGFWKKLVSQIENRLSRTPVLRPRSQGPLRLIRELGQSSNLVLDKNQQPLFDDIQPEVYLSKFYEAEDLGKLRNYGLKYILMDKIIQRVAADLKRSTSRMKSPITDDDWHSRASRLLLFPFREGRRGLIHELKEMELLPTSRGWKSATREIILPLYFPEANGAAIPTDLPVSLIDSTAAKNPDRRKLFTLLGVTTASVETIRRMIFQKYTSGEMAKSLFPSSRYFGFLSSQSHLKFLYLTHIELSVCRPDYGELGIYTQDESLVRPNEVDVYISNNHPYSAHELLRQTNAGTEPGSGAPGFAVSFLREEYLQEIQSQPNYHNLTLLDWLYSCLGIRRHLRLISNGSLTDICKYVAEHRPEKFLGTLQYHWQLEKQAILGSDDIVETLRNIEVLCQGDEMHNLSKTYLPLPELKQCCARFVEEGESFPFLKLEASLSQANLSEWMFLHSAFGVRSRDDVDMYLTILVKISKNKWGDMFKRVARVFDLYQVLHAKYLESEKSFRDNFLVLLPGDRVTRYPWAAPETCRWDAPPDMRSRHPLGSFYDNYFRGSETNKSTLTQFFRGTLGIRDCTCFDFVDELKELKQTNCSDFDMIKGLYGHLDRMKSKVTAYEKEKQDFEDNALIFVPAGGDHGWHKASPCLWSSATQIRGKITISDHYASMKTFFVDFLGIATLSLRMVYDELKEMGASDRTTVTEVKETLWAFNSFLSAEKELPKPEPILNGRLFPVRYPDGHTELRSAETPFAIVDRKPLGDAFRGKAKLLDFTLDEVRRLKPFLQWARLEPSYLSTAVKEVSALEGDGQVPISSPERDIRKKAHALFRVAVHFESRRANNNDRSLYDILKGANVLETDGISSELHLSQGDQIYIVQAARSELHIQEDQSGLKVYVPRDASSQEVCYYSKLPRGLVEWMMTDEPSQTQRKVDETAVRVVNSVLNARKSALPRILESEGITGVYFADEEDEEDKGAMGHAGRPPTAQLPKPTTPLQASGLASVPVTPSPRSDGEALSYETPISSIPSIASPQTNHSGNTKETRLIPRVSQSAPVLAVNGMGVDVDAGYVRLLEKILNAARRAVFPSRGSFNLSELLRALPEDGRGDGSVFDDPGGFFLNSQIERDKKIGAAGELFAFELLSRLHPPLPSFSRDNWQSTIRRCVAIHPEYYNLAAWNGHETAGIAYHDSDGVLTGILIDKGYLSSDTWSSRRPQYFIEVKSTPGPCETPFLMSKRQYQMMKDRSNGESGSENPDSIYVIFRVFNLSKESVDFRIYVDPEVMRERMDLVFKEEAWSVVPATVRT